ncbi:glycine betaine ABC transporter substrate-binding protein [Clostridium sp.]|uniref:ABC transporter permease/substrate-binding protein n=1 Tax=Clostridium sp. TaxID=1506 RepID=UPI0026051355|nr:glycine betaine ABC transporter substrate-binding protein [Clostridium sp.]
MIKDIFNIYAERWDFFFKLIVEHLWISAISIIIATILGLGIGIIISEYKKYSTVVLGIVNFVYTVPSISLLGFLIPFSGIGNKTAIIALSVYALLPMVRNTNTGIDNINFDIIESAKGMGSTNFQILYKIKIPLAVPVIISGLRSMVVMTIALAGIASFIGAGGLGVAIYRGITTNNPAMTIAGSLLIAIIAFISDFILGILEKTIQKIRVKSFRERKIKESIIAAIVIGISIIVVMNFKSDSKVIKIATKPMTEQYILGEMISILIQEETDIKVEMTQGVGGGTANIQPALERGEFDLYPEYTGTAWSNVLKNEEIYKESMFEELESEYKEKYNFSWVGMYGFNNTYGLAVRKEIADKYNIITYSDLQKVSNQLIFGAEYDFYEREDGYNALCNTYGYTFEKEVDLDIGLKYQAINSGEIDVMNIFTTDGQISISDVTVLIDDKNFYPSYKAGTVVRDETLKIYPEVTEILKKMEGIFSDEDIARLNYEVESNGREPKEVAKEYLKENGLIP